MAVTRFLSHFRPGLLRVLRISAALLTAAVGVAFATLGYNLGAAYYWFMLSALVPALAFVVFRRAYVLAKARSRAREHWKARGQDIERVRHTRFEHLRESYSTSTRDDSRGFVDDRTWSDLGMDEIHDRVDVCFTMAGRNELYRILRHSLPQHDLVEERATRLARFIDDPEDREQISCVLSGIGEEADADPASVLWGDGAKPNRLFPLFVTMATVAALSVVVAAAIDLTAGLISILITFLVNMWIYYRKAKHISVYVPALRVLSRMITASADLPAVEQRKVVSGARGALKMLLTGAPSPLPSLSGDLLEMFLLYLKIFFQVDLLAYERIAKHIVAHRASYQSLYQSIGRLDAIFALASYRARKTTTCDAETTALPVPGSPDTVSGSMRLDGAYHPLVPDAVANSIQLSQPGAIVTGTNMAGKSTFLRTVGINVIFAQTAGYAFADGYRAERFRVLSSIDKRDDLAEGKSFYYDEAERIYRMIAEVEADVPALLLIDELLSGTNSLEREGASIAILGYLADHNALTVAATHDVTIAAGVQDRYSLFYFTDSADEKGLRFDYTIQKGIVKTRNAIKLLSLIGYPEDVIRAALDRTE